MRYLTTTNYYGTLDRKDMKGYTSRRYRGIPAGLWIRRDIGKDKTFRVRRGNGYYGSVVGERIQDRYTYNVSDPNADHVGIGNKERFADAVAAWQALTESEKDEWRELEKKRKGTTGYTLFIANYIRIFGHMYDRGDPAVWDFTLTDFTTDGTWHDLDLSAIVPAGAKAVLIHVAVGDDVVNSRISFRKNGNSYEINQGFMRTQVANVYLDDDMIIPCDSNRIIEYCGSILVFSGIYLTVKGWWK